MFKCGKLKYVGNLDYNKVYITDYAMSVQGIIFIVHTAKGVTHLNSSTDNICNSRIFENELSDQYVGYHDFVATWTKVLNSGGEVRVLALDSKAAFDHVWHQLKG